MTTNIIRSNSTSAFNFTAGGNTLIILANADIGTGSLDAIATTFGEENVTIHGSVTGVNGFVDSSTVGVDDIDVGLNGAIVGTGGSAISIFGNGSYIANTGFIESGKAFAIVAGSGNFINNHGHIIGFASAITDGGSDNINNSGTISSLLAGNTTINENTGDDKIQNSGLISGNGDFTGIYLNGADDTVGNTGTIDGALIALLFEGGNDFLANSGTISGLSDAIGVNGALGGVTIKNSGLIESQAAAGTAISFGDSGEQDSLNNSGLIRGSVQVDSFASTINNSGSLDGSVDFAAVEGVVRNTGDISGSVFFYGDDNSYYGGYGSIEGDVYCAGTVGDYVGGARGTTFVITASDLVVTEKIVGGASADDTLIIGGEGSSVITARDLKNVSGIETIDIGISATIFLTQALADSASGHALMVQGGGRNTFNLMGVTSATDSITVTGGANDTIDVGAALTTFAFQSVANSTGAKFDTIANANFSHDEFDASLCGNVITGINAAVIAGALSSLTFDANLAADLGASQLGANHAVLFTASSGTLSGDTFLIVDCNGTAGYQAGADLVMRLTGATGTLSTANFL